MFHFDSFAWIAILSYLCIAAITLCCVPRNSLPRAERGSLVFLIAGSLIAYASASIWIFLLGWTLTVIPFRSSRASRTLWFSTFALFIGAVLSANHTDNNARWFAFTAIIIASLLRKGTFPFHSWVPFVFDDAPMPSVNLLLNSHLGAYLVIRYAVPLVPDLAASSLSFLGALAIITSLYTATIALVAKRPRRILALLCTSQASFILAGLENRNVEGISGALVHWSVVAFATTSLLAVYTALEARTSEVDSPEGFLGLGFHAPRLAVFFSIAALTLVGLPGTLGFAAEDLLFHGSLESHPLLGIGLPLATALNAITGLRLIATLFWGRRGIHVPFIPDASPRERRALSVPLIVLIAGGISPSIFIGLRSPSAYWIASLLAAR
jgi:NADH:ubiquinone oxidoreductase subunit 4 (subunit M)